MAEVIGPLTLLNKALPTGVDGTRIAEWQLRDGLTYAELVNTMALAIGAFNQEMVARWGWMFSLTEEIFMEYPNGGSVSEMPEITDVDDITTLHGTTLGHMIDFKHYGRAIGGSKFYFRDIRSAQVMAAVRNLVLEGQWRFEKKLLTRFFTNTENAIGSSGYDVPFVRGTGGSVDFAPPAYDGEAFATSHDHFLGVNDDTLSPADSLNQMAETLQEHGHEAPFTALVSRTDIASYTALTKWVEIVEPVGAPMMIDRGGETSGNQMFVTTNREMGKIGYFQSDYGLVEVRASYRIPTLYSGMTKSYGQLDARNALAVRVHPDVGFGLYLLPETTNDDKYPIKKVDVLQEFGIGVGQDRTNGAVAYLVSGGVFANPTIS